MTARALFPAGEVSGDAIAELDADVPGTLWGRVANPEKRPRDRFGDTVLFRIVSKDPDEIEEYRGVLLPGPDQVFTLLIDGDTMPTTFPKCTNSGVTLWRKS